MIQAYPELQDQLDLIQKIQQKPTLSKHNQLIVAWAAALVLKDHQLVSMVKERFGDLAETDKRLLAFATSRMSVTNPYFMSRNIHPLQAGGSLQDLNMRPFPELNVTDDIAYHYACVAISLVNSGFVCFNSHLSSLKAARESELAIDLALRLVAAIRSQGQTAFNSEYLL